MLTPMAYREVQDAIYQWDVIAETSEPVEPIEPKTPYNPFDDENGETEYTAS